MKKHPLRSKRLSFNNLLTNRNNVAVGLLVLSLAIAGLLTIQASRADTLTVAAEAESGTVEGNAVPGEVTGASGNASIKFGLPIPIPVPPPPGCALPNYPNETCTGVPAGTQLTAVTEKLMVLDANTVIDGKDLQGCVSIFAPGVVIKNSKISCPNGDAVFVSDNGTVVGDLTIQNSEIACSPANNFGITGHHVKAQRLNIHGCRSAGIYVTGKFSIEDSYIHNLQAGAGVTGIVLGTTGSTDHLLQHNTVLMNSGLSAIRMLGNIPNSKISDNLLAGGTYTLSCSAAGAGTNISILNNHFSTQFYPTSGSTAPWEYCSQEAHVSGNVIHETGQPVQ